MDNAVILPKSCFDLKTRSFLSYKEIISRGIGDYTEIERFNNAALVIVENTPVQIELLVQDGIFLHESNFAAPGSGSFGHMPWESLAAVVDSRVGQSYGLSESLNIYLSRAFI